MMKKLLLLLLFPAITYGQFDSTSSQIPDSVSLKFIQFKANSSLTSTVNLYQDENNENLVVTNGAAFNGRLQSNVLWMPEGAAHDTGDMLSINPVSGPFSIDTAGRISSGRLRLRGVMPNAGVTSRFWQTSANGTEIINTSTQTVFSDSIAIGTGAIEAGSTLHFRTYLTAGHTNATPTVTIRLRWDAEVIATAGITFAAASGASSIIAIDWYVTVISATTTRTTWTATYYPGTGSYITYPGLNDATLSATDFTDAGHLKFSAQWTAASAANKITMKQIIGDYSDAP
jgi:hypothetical protein